MKFLYLDKKDRIVAWFTPRHSAMAVGTLLVVLAIPVWKESVTGNFVLEPVRQAVVRAHVPGTLTKIYVQEGETVPQGSLLAALSNLPVQGGLDDAHARLVLASVQAKEAALNYQGYGNALMEKQRSERQYGQASEMNSALELKAPLTGTVMTPKVQEQLGTYLKTGAELVEIADLSQMRAKIYASEYDMYKIRAGQAAKVQLDGMLWRRNGQVELVSARPAEPPPWAAEAGKDPKTEGPQQYYFVDILIENPGDELKPGMTGIARVYGSRRSIGGMALEVIKNFWGRKLW